MRVRSLASRLAPGPVQQALEELQTCFIKAAQAMGTDEEEAESHRFNVAANTLDDELGKLLR